VKAKAVKPAKVAKPVSKSPIKKLADLNAVPAVVEKTEVMEVTEITEMPVTQ
jgi:hypothetical protein